MAKANHELTPMRRQYFSLKEKHKDCILFFRLGDFYEMFDDDATVAAKELDLTLTTRDRGKPQEEQTPMCGVPYHSVDSYIVNLISINCKLEECSKVLESYILRLNFCKAKCSCRIETVLNRSLDLRNLKTCECCKILCSDCLVVRIESASLKTRLESTSVCKSCCIRSLSNCCSKLAVRLICIEYSEFITSSPISLYTVKSSLSLLD